MKDPALTHAHGFKGLSEQEVTSPLSASVQSRGLQGPFSCKVSTKQSSFKKKRPLDMQRSCQLIPEKVQKAEATNADSNADFAAVSFKKENTRMSCHTQLIQILREN